MTYEPSTPTSSNTFPERADVESSSDAYAKRFDGKSGAWMLAVQERLCLDLLNPLGKSTRILDVGGGHGQLAIPLVRHCHDVTVLGSEPGCAHRIKSVLETGAARFVVGNVIDLPFANQSFDVVISFRMVTHCQQWERLISELCRVARRSVIVDYPTSQSLNAIAPALFKAKKKIEVNTRVWRLFRHDDIADIFSINGFQLFGVRKQFFLPMVVHRMLKFQKLSTLLEGSCRLLGFTQLLGSPVITRFDRC